MARLLIEKGADVNASDDHGWTPLLRALKNGFEAIARHLIDNGADVNASNRYGWTKMETQHDSSQGYDPICVGP